MSQTFWRQSGHLYIYISVYTYIYIFIYIRYDGDYSNKSRSRNPSRGKREKREREREEKERKVSQRRRIEKRGYIIYIRVLKDCTRMAGLPRKTTATAAPRDSTRLIVAKTTFVLYGRQRIDEGPIGNRETYHRYCAIASPRQSLCRSTNSIRLRDQCNVQVIDPTKHACH